MANRLRKLRRSKSMRQLRIATYLHITTKQYQNYELGLMQIPDSLLERLSKFFNVPVEYFTDENYIEI